MHCCVFFFFFKQKTAYEMRISDWSSDVCSSDLQRRLAGARTPDQADLLAGPHVERQPFDDGHLAAIAETDGLEADLAAGHRQGLGTGQIGRASCRARVCQYV